MFKLEVTKLDNEIEYIYNMNIDEDDFIRFIPGQFGVPKENVKVFTMDDSKKDELEAYLQLGPEYMLELGESGKIKVVTISEQLNDVTQAMEQTITPVKEYAGTLIQWPYIENLAKDKKGNFIHFEGLEFLGNGHEL